MLSAFFQWRNIGMIRPCTGWILKSGVFSHLMTFIFHAAYAEPYGKKIRGALQHLFTEVIRACAAPSEGRCESWINDEIVALYTTLNERGHAHSVEAWLDQRLVGGLYGVSLGAAFGESMFSTVRDASKVALSTPHGASKKVSIVC